MNFEKTIERLKTKKLAGFLFEKDVHAKFKDCVIICKNGRLMFLRFNYGEAASLVCKLQGTFNEGNVSWNYDTTNYSGRHEAPKKLTNETQAGLFFDDEKTQWVVKKEYKFLPELGQGRLKMLFGK